MISLRTFGLKVGLILLMELVLSFFGSRLNSYAESLLPQSDLIDCLGIGKPVELPTIDPVLHHLECEEKRFLISEGLQNLESRKMVLERLANKRPDVWLLGEQHSQDSVNYQPSLIREVKAADPRVDCLFAEFSPGTEDRWADIATLTMTSDRYIQVATMAGSLGLRVVFVDPYKRAYLEPNPDLSSVKQFAFDVHVRNKGMGDEIEKTLSSGKCHVGVYIVGMGHLFSTFGGFQTKNIQQFLRESKRSSISVNLRVASDKVEAVEACQQDLPSAVKSQTGFLHKKSEVRIPLYQLGGNYNDFDATLLLPSSAP